MGNILPVSANGGAVARSGYPREEECARYWIQAGIGVGDLADIYDGGGDDGSDNVGAPPRMAAHMNREQSGSRYERVFVSFHSNGGGGAARGTIALHNSNHPGTYTTNQLRLAQLLGQEVNDDLVALGPLEASWNDRGTAVTLSRSDISFGEINNVYIDDEFDAMSDQPDLWSDDAVRYSEHWAAQRARARALLEHLGISRADDEVGVGRPGGPVYIPAVRLPRLPWRRRS
jgi:hypothetical protein